MTTVRYETRVAAVVHGREIRNRSCCCSSWTEELEIVRCLTQANAIGLVLGCTSNNSTARFQLLPIHKELQD